MTPTPIRTLRREAPAPPNPPPTEPCHAQTMLLGAPYGCARPAFHPGPHAYLPRTRLPLPDGPFCGLPDPENPETACDLPAHHTPSRCHYTPLPHCGLFSPSGARCGRRIGHVGACGAWWDRPDDLTEPPPAVLLPGALRARLCAVESDEDGEDGWRCARPADHTDDHQYVPADSGLYPCVHPLSGSRAVVCTLPTNHTPPHDYEDVAQRERRRERCGDTWVRDGVTYACVRQWAHHPDHLFLTSASAEYHPQPVCGLLSVDATRPAVAQYQACIAPLDHVAAAHLFCAVPLCNAPVAGSTCNLPLAHTTPHRPPLSPAADARAFRADQARRLDLPGAPDAPDAPDAFDATPLTPTRADRAGDRQPLPTPGRQAVTDALIADLRARTALGIQRYGRPLETFNGRDAIHDALEEALDLAQYLKQAVLEDSAKDAALLTVRDMVEAIQQDTLPWGQALTEIRAALASVGVTTPPAGDGEAPALFALRQQMHTLRTAWAAWHGADGDGDYRTFLATAGHVLDTASAA